MRLKTINMMSLLVWDVDAAQVGIWVPTFRDNLWVSNGQAVQDKFFLECVKVQEIPGIIARAFTHINVR
jgi:hypothetical protein